MQNLQICPLSYLFGKKIQIKKRLIEEQVHQILQDSIIESSTGPGAAPVVIVNWLGSNPWFFVDYRGVNQVIQKDSFSLAACWRVTWHSGKRSVHHNTGLSSRLLTSGIYRGVAFKDSLYISLQSLPVLQFPLWSLQHTSNISETDEQCINVSTSVEVPCVHVPLVCLCWCLWPWPIGAALV